MKKIELTQGKFALVDDDDFEELNKWNWSLSTSGSGRYATRRNGIKNGGSGELITMHRQVMNAPKGTLVDHIDGDGLNNQKKNLRICTHAENIRNRKKPNVNNEKYMGIKTVHNKKGLMYRAIIGHNGKTIHLGMFVTQEAAAIAYDRAAKKYFGQFARLNFPNGEPDIPEYQKQPSTNYFKEWWKNFFRTK